MSRNETLSKKLLKSCKTVAALACLVFFIGSSVFAQEKKKHEVTPLTLTRGVYYDQPIPLAPKNFKRGGFYTKLVDVDYISADKKIRITPKIVGDGSLFINDPKTNDIIYEFRINVKKSNLFGIANEIQGLLQDIEGINIRTINDKVLVDGQVLLPSEMKRIHNVVGQYPGQTANLAILSPIAEGKIAEFMEREINNPEVQVKAVNNLFMILGVVQSVEEKQRAQIIADAYLPDLVVDNAVNEKKVLQNKSKPGQRIINLLKIAPPPAAGPKKIIQLVVHFVELQKSYEKGFRFQWTPSLGDESNISFSTGSQTAGNAVTSLTGIINNLFPKLNWAKQHGHARVLKSSSLLVQEGVQGTITAEDDIPYVTTNAEGQPQTLFAKAGVNTKMTATISGARGDSVDLQMNIGVSSLVGQSGGQPQIARKTVETSLIIKNSQSAAVGGLISSTSTKNYNRLPANASSNPLISLYRSKDFSRAQSQFVVFVTPIIKSSASEGSDKIKKKFRLQN